MKPEAVIIHHEGANNGFNSVNEYHKTRWPNFESSLGYWAGYQWFYNKRSGWIQAREEDEEGAHTLGGWNRKSIGVCFQGNYDEEPFLFERELEEKIKDIRSRWGNLPVKTHGELWSTACPGKDLQRVVDAFRDREKVKLLKIIVGLYKKIIELMNIK